MATITIGQAFSIGGQTAISGYVVLEEGTDVDVVMEEQEDADGAIVALFIFEKRPIVNLTLVATTGTFSEFPKGALCTATGYTDYYVQDAKIVKSKSAMKGTITLIQYPNLGS